MLQNMETIVGRPRQFDEAKALEAVVSRFWSHGYENTSVRDLELATGMGVTSLYNAFGPKHALFRKALERYSERHTRACIREIEQLSSPSARIRAFVTRVTEAALSDPDRRGCLVINTAVEKGPRDPEITKIVAAHLREVEEFFRRNIEAAITAGEISPEISAVDTARTFSAAMFGLRVMARTCPAREMMEGALRPLLGLLRKDTQPPVASATENRIYRERTSE